VDKEFIHRCDVFAEQAHLPTPLEISSDFSEVDSPFPFPNFEWSKPLKVPVTLEIIAGKRVERVGTNCGSQTFPLRPKFDGGAKIDRRNHSADHSGIGRYRCFA
jgi:hypothetical protein